MTRWSPDTCACQIEYDSAGNFTATAVACARHAASANTAAHLTAVLAENRKKNGIIAGISAATPTAGIVWSIDATGHMTVKASAIPTNALNQLQAQFPGVTIAVDATIPSGG